MLGVSSSLTGRGWRGLSAEASKEAERLTSFAGLNAIAAKTFARLGATLETLDQFVEPKLRDLLPDPSVLHDMDQATARILTAIQSKEKIAIFADYDVDGAASASLLICYLRCFDIEPTLYIPDRIKEGYGPNIAAMEMLANAHSLIITVDCGSLAFEPIERARDLGADVVILDHHMTAPTLPNAITVNPNRQDCDNAYGMLCAAGVVFLLLVSLNRARASATPNLIEMLDLVALATIADIAPLTGVNRALVRTGLQVMNARQRPGLRALIDAHLEYQDIRTDHIGFTLGPRLNAGGRIGRPHAATELLTAQNEDDAAKIVSELEQQNLARREIETQIVEEAIAQIEANPRTQNFVYALGDNWHPGVLGIVASRLKSHFNKPALALGRVQNEITGSARSIAGIDLGGAIAMLASEALITKGGGHKMAAGLSLREDMLESAMRRLDDALERQANRADVSLQIDAIIVPQSMSVETLSLLDRAGPYGASAPAPIYAIADCRLIHRQVLKDRHIKYRFSSHNQEFETIIFGAVGGPLDLGENVPIKQRFHVAITAKKNFWQGRETVQFMLEDIAPLSMH